MSTRARRIAVTAACLALFLLLCGPRQSLAQTAPAAFPPPPLTPAASAATSAIQSAVTSPAPSSVPASAPASSAAAAPASSSPTSPASTAAAPSVSPGNQTPLEGWLLAGIDADLRDRWRGTIAAGHLGGFESQILLTDVTFTANRAVQLAAGYLYLRPTSGSPATNVLRSGVIWLPLRGRLSIDNRLLIERRWTRHVTSSIRLRDRLRLSCALDDRLRLRVFGAVESFALAGSGFSEVRYQAGVTAPAGPMAFEIYWLQSRPVRRSGFNTLGVTALWRLQRH